MIYMPSSYINFTTVLHYNTCKTLIYLKTSNIVIYYISVVYTGENMGKRVIQVRIDENVIREFYVIVAKKYGMRLGSVSRAFEEALRNWIEKEKKR